MPTQNPMYRLYVVSGDNGEVRLISTCYPEKYVRALVAARNHQLCAQLTDIENLRTYGSQVVESFAEYMHQVADDTLLRELMPQELKRDIVNYLGQRAGDLDDADTQLYCAIQKPLRRLIDAA